MSPRLLTAILVAAAVAGAQEPYARLQDEGAAFLGPAPAPAAGDTVRLGVVGPATGRAAEALRAGVELAVADANAAGRGPHLLALYRGDDGPWSSAAATAVALVREEGVAALLAGPDGGRAHACELVAAKLWIPVLAPAAADHSVDYANVPWTFRVGPDDRQQLAVLLEAAVTRGWRRLGWVDDGHRDSAVALGTARRLAAAASIDIAPSSPGESEPACPCGGDRVDAALVWSGLDEAPATIDRARRLHGEAPLLGPWTLQGAPSGVPVLVSTPATSPALDGRLRGLDAGAGHMAALAYDAVSLLADCLAGGRAGPAPLRACVAASTHAGTTGPVSFDALGGRRDPGLSLREVVSPTH